MNPIQLDTTEAATDTIAYVARGLVSHGGQREIRQVAQRLWRPCLPDRHACYRCNHRFSVILWRTLAFVIHLTNLTLLHP